MYVLHNCLLYILILIDDGNSTLILVSALLSVVAFIAIATACALGVWVFRLRCNPSKMDQTVKSNEPSLVASNNYTTLFPNNSPKSCPFGNVPGQPVSGSKQHDDQRPKEDAASESHIVSGSGSSRTSAETEANRSDKSSQPAKAGEQSQEEENQDQEPVQLWSMEDKVSESNVVDFDGERSLDERLETPYSPTSSILSCLRSLSPPLKNDEERKKLVENEEEHEETNEKNDK